MLLDSAITTRNRVPTRSRQALVRIVRRILETCWCHPTDYRTFRLYTGVFIGAPTTGPREPCYRGLFEAGGNGVASPVGSQLSAAKLVVHPAKAPTADCSALHQQFSRFSSPTHYERFQARISDRLW